MATETAADSGSTDRRERWFDWFDTPLITLCLASLAVVVLGGLVQVSFGTYSMTVVEAWQAVFNPKVIFDLQA